MKTFIKTVFIFFAALTFTSCDKSELSSTPESLSKKEIQNLAFKHNQSLDITFNSLNELKKELKGDVDLSKVLDNTKESLNRSYDEIFSQYDDVKTAIEFSDREISKYYDSAFVSSPIVSVVNKYFNHLTENQRRLLIECNAALSNPNSSLNQIINRLNNIAAKAKNELTSDDAQIILIATEVGKMSVTYWNKNFSKWETLISGQNNLKGKWFNWNNVTGADISGAVEGAVGAVFLNAVPGGGQVSYGGTILGAAAAGSAGNAVSQIWNHYFKNSNTMD